jgi:hypothetical protein
MLLLEIYMRIVLLYEIGPMRLILFVSSISRLVKLWAFLMHIRNQLFIALNNRHKAYEELLKLKLPSECRQLIDCQNA